MASRRASSAAAFGLRNAEFKCNKSSALSQLNAGTTKCWRLARLASRRARCRDFSASFHRRAEARSDVLNGLPEPTIFFPLARESFTVEEAAASAAAAAAQDAWVNEMHTNISE